MRPSLMAWPISALCMLVSTMLLAALPAPAAEPESAPPASRPAVTPPAKGQFHIYLLMGQSNMAGRDRSKLDEQVDNPRILQMTPEGEWVVAKDPMHAKRGRTEPGAGPGIPFAREMLKEDDSITIGLIPCAVGGSGLRSWLKGAKYHEIAVQRAKAAADVGTLKGILWHQGEADTTKKGNADSYGDRLAKMVHDIRAELNAPNLPVVVGQIGTFLSPEKYPYAQKVRDAIRKTAEVVPHVGYADSNGLTDVGDRLHFNAASQQLLGERFAKAMTNLEAEPARPADRNGASQ